MWWLFNIWEGPRRRAGPQGFKRSTASGSRVQASRLSFYAVFVCSMTPGPLCFGLCAILVSKLGPCRLSSIHSGPRHFLVF